MEFPRERTLGWATIPSSRGLPHPAGKWPGLPSYLGLNYSRASCPLAERNVVRACWCGVRSGSRRSPDPMVQEFVGAWLSACGRPGPSGPHQGLGTAPVLSRASPLSWPTGQTGELPEETAAASPKSLQGRTARPAIMPQPSLPALCQTSEEAARSPSAPTRLLAGSAGLSASEAVTHPLLLLLTRPRSLPAARLSHGWTGDRAQEVL